MQTATDLVGKTGTGISTYVQKKAISPGNVDVKYFKSVTPLIPFIIIMFLNILSGVTAILSVFSSTGDNDQSGYNLFRLSADSASFAIMSIMVIASMFFINNSTFSNIWTSGQGSFMIFLFIWLGIQLVVIIFDALRYTESIETESTGQLDLIELLDFSSTMFNIVLFTFLTVGAFMDNGLDL